MDFRSENPFLATKLISVCFGSASRMRTVSLLPVCTPYEYMYIVIIDVTVREYILPTKNIRT